MSATPTVPAAASPTCPVRVRVAGSGGFTMIELVIVMVLVAVLAFVAIPRLNTGSLTVMPVAEQIAAEIRYAQNLALTRAATHSFIVSGNTVSISGSTGATLSTGESLKAFDDVTLGGDSPIAFDPRFGKPTPEGGATITVSGGGNSVNVVISGETGYVQIVE